MAQGDRHDGRLGLPEMWSGLLSIRFDLSLLRTGCDVFTNVHGSNLGALACAFDRRPDAVSGRHLVLDMIPFPPIYLKYAGYRWYGFFISEMCQWCANNLISIDFYTNYCLHCGRIQARRWGTHVTIQ